MMDGNNKRGWQPAGVGSVIFDGCMLPCFISNKLDFCPRTEKPLTTDIPLEIL